MSYFGLNSVNQNQQLDIASSNPAGVRSESETGFFDNAGGAALSGLYSGLVAKPDQLLWAGVDTVISPIARFINENAPFRDTSPEFIAEQRKLAQEQVRRLTPDAATTGTAGQVLYGLFDMGGQAVAGTALAGPLGGAAAVTSLQGFSEYERLRAEGVDVSTAQDVALVHGLTAGAGALLPMSIGLRAGGALAEGVGAQIARTGESTVRNVLAATARAAPDVAYAAGINVAFGMTQRGLTASTLRRAGYDEMAAQYDVFDRQALAIDAVLGVAFGGIGRFMNARGESVRPPDFAPVDVDAALAANAAQHAEFDVAPGVPVNVLSRNAHAQALQKAMRDLSEGNRVDVASIAERADFSVVPGRRNLISSAIDEALFAADEGTTARAAETKIIEQQASQILTRADRKIWQSEIANSERIIAKLESEDAGIRQAAPTGSAGANRRYFDENRGRLNEIARNISYSRERLNNAKNTLAQHEPGGVFFEARAELARRQQAETDLNAQALSYYKTADVITSDQAAPLNTARPLAEVDQQSVNDIDLQFAEDSLTAAPDMLITVLDDEGNPQSRSAREMLDEAKRESEQAEQDAGLFDVAVACFLRG